MAIYPLFVTNYFQVLRTEDWPASATLGKIHAKILRGSKGSQAGARNAIQLCCTETDWEDTETDWEDLVHSPSIATTGES